MTPRVIFHFLIIVLCFQVATLQPALAVFSVSTVGETKTIVKEAMTETRSSITEAILQSSKNENFDSVIFTGDVMLGRDVETKISNYGLDYPYRGLSLKDISSNAAVVGNFESSMKPQHAQTPAYNLNFSVSPLQLEELHKAGFSHVSLANNHSLDFGEEGYLNAVNLLQEAQIKPFGHNKLIDRESITYLETQRGEIAIIGINASQHKLNEAEVKLVLQKANRTSDFQVVYIHWGDEYESAHSDTQRQIAEYLVDLGADLIVGHHPHVIQDVDIINGVLVFYSLGNFIFDQYFSTEVQQGLVLGFELKDEIGITIYPVSSEANKAQPAFMQGEEASKILNKLAATSHPSVRPYIEEGYVPLLHNVATSTKMAMMVR